MKNRKVVGFIPFNVLEDKLHGMYGVHGCGYDDSNGLLMEMIKLNDAQKLRYNAKYKVIYYSGVPKSLAMSLIKGEDFDCFFPCLFSGKYNIEGYEYCS